MQAYLGLLPSEMSFGEKQRKGRITKIGHPPDVLALLQRGDPSWENLVLPEVAKMIKEQKLLGYRG